MCTRAYPVSTVYAEGADGECDMDSSTENANSSDSLNPRRQDRSVAAISEFYQVSGEFILNFLWFQSWDGRIRFLTIKVYNKYCSYTSCYATLATWLLTPPLHPLSLGRSNLRTMVRGRMWILLPAVLALKMKPEQMVSQIWDPPFHPG